MFYSALILHYPEKKGGTTMRREILLSCLLGMFMATTAYGTPINLNDFWADPTVTIAPDGSWATISEDQTLALVLLSNDPGLNDPEVIFAGSNIFLSFEYNFVEGSSINNDEFGAFVLDSTGYSAGPGYEFFTQDTSSGIVSFDLFGLTDEPYIGLQFQLSALYGDVDLNSVVTVSNVQTKLIPEPGTIILVLSGLSGIAALSGIKLTRRKC